MKSRAIGFDERVYVGTVGLEREWLRYAVPVGRVLFALLFLLSAPRHFLRSTVAYAASAGVPAPGLLVPLAGAIALAGAISVIIGFYARIGALLLIIFLVPVPLLMHQFWAVNDPVMAMIQEAAFFKNVSILGAAVMLLYWGAGPVSVDWVRARKAPVRPSEPPPAQAA